MNCKQLCKESVSADSLHTVRNVDLQTTPHAYRFLTVNDDTEAGSSDAPHGEEIGGLTNHTRTVCGDHTDRLVRRPFAKKLQIRETLHTETGLDP